MPLDMTPDHFTPDSHCCACLTGDWQHDGPTRDECEFCIDAMVILFDGRTVKLTATFDCEPFLPVHVPASFMEIPRLAIPLEYRATLAAPPRECLGIFRTNNPIRGCAGPDGQDSDFLCIRCRMQQETERSQNA